MPFYKHPHQPVSKALVEEYAGRYEYAPAPEFTPKGFLTYKEFCQIGVWKSHRQRKNYERNDPAFVEEITRVSFAPGSSEELRIGVLTLLRGVRYPVASTLLHLGCDQRYPIIDFRALWTLWRIAPSEIIYTPELWVAYVETCRKLARDCGVDVRTLDKALWQYSREHQAAERADEA